MSKPIIRPGHKPEWLRQQLGMVEQREQMIRDAIYQLETTIAEQGHDTPATVCRALDQSHSDLEEVLQQQAVLIKGWDAYNLAP